MLSASFRSDWGYLPAHAADAHEVDDGTHEPAGEWWGQGAASLGLTGHATPAAMADLYERLQSPLDGSPLGQRPRVYASHKERLAKLRDAEPERTPERDTEIQREARKTRREARHYLDLTFSPPKSYSVLHAALEHSGRHDEARAVWDAWMEGVHAGLDHLMAEVDTTRAGKGERIAAPNWVISVWRHHLSRAGDMQLHTHAAVLNRVECADGRWRSLDGRSILRHRHETDDLVKMTAEQALSRTLRVEFRDHEIVGIREPVRELFSSRRREIVEGARQLEHAYAAKHERAPDAYRRTLIAQHVTLATRPPKPRKQPVRSLQLSRWDRQMAERLSTNLAEVLREVDYEAQRLEEPAMEARVLTHDIQAVDRRNGRDITLKAGTSLDVLRRPDSSPHWDVRTFAVVELDGVTYSVDEREFDNASRIHEPRVEQEPAVSGVRERLSDALEGLRERAVDRLAEAVVKVQNVERHDRFQLWQRDERLWVVGVDRNDLPWAVCGPVNTAGEARREPWDRREKLERIRLDRDQFQPIRELKPHELAMGATSWDQIKFEERDGKWRVAEHAPVRERLSDALEGLRERAVEKVEQLLPPERIAQHQFDATDLAAAARRDLEEARRQQEEVARLQREAAQRQRQK